MTEGGENGGPGSERLVAPANPDQMAQGGARDDVG